LVRFSLIYLSQIHKHNTTTHQTTERHKRG